MAGPTRSGRRRSTVPVFTVAPEPSAPPLAVFRVDEPALQRVGCARHTHDLPGLAYFEDAGGAVSSGERWWDVQAGDVYLFTPGVALDVGDPGGLLRASGWVALLGPETLGGLDRSGVGPPTLLPPWQVTGTLGPAPRSEGGQHVRRLRVSPEDRATCTRALAAMERELSERRPGYRRAVLAHLAVLLVEVDRAAPDLSVRPVAGDHVVAEVLGVIEDRFQGRLSLREVAAAVHRSPGHLTTTIRRRTGRTVQDWITVRRMAEARRLLLETDLAVAEVGRRAGYPDPAYFVRAFHQWHGLSPGRWRPPG